MSRYSAEDAKWLAHGLRKVVSRETLAALYAPTKPVEPVYIGPTLHEHISASHSMLLAMHVARRSPPRPRYVHCWDCRVPVTPSGRKALITEPPTGSRKDADALCGIIRYHRARLTPPAQSVAE